MFAQGEDEFQSAAFAVAYGDRPAVDHDGVFDDRKPESRAAQLARAPLVDTVEPVSYTHLDVYKRQSVVLWLLQRMRLNIMRITILSGTFALALAFAGNDLVNFIGVPLASYDAWQIAREAGSESIMMGELAEPARANFLLLLACLLYTSRGV